MIPQTDSPKGQWSKDLRRSPGAAAHHLPTDSRQMPADLTLIIERWEHLSVAVRAGVVAMVKASLNTR
jgi:hypothetical protein